MVISGKTRVIGIFGNPIEHSFSPVMHNRAFNFLGLDFCYVPFLVAEADLKAAVRAVRALNMVGVNVTIPHKEKVLDFLDEVAPEAKAIGAVNVIVNQDGKLTGHNTDGSGFYRSLVEETGEGVAGKNIVLLGAGGAARGVGMQLASEGAARISIMNRSVSGAEDLARAIRQFYPGCDLEALPLEEQTLARVLPEAHLLVNCTPVGMYPHYRAVSPVEPQFLHPGLVVCDLIYNPLETLLLQEAKKIEARVVSGLGMLLYQGALAFELWTGHKAPVEVMRKELLAKLKV